MNPRAMQKPGYRLNFDMCLLVLHFALSRPEAIVSMEASLPSEEAGRQER